MGKWIEGPLTSGEIVESVISSMLDLENFSYEKSGDEFNTKIQFNVSDRKTGMESKGEFFIRTSLSTCPTCTKKLGNYYEAILQIRGGTVNGMEEALDYSVRSIEHQGSSEIFVTRMQKNKEGYDLFISDKQFTRNIGRLLTEKFGGSYKETSHLVGRKKGNDLYRITVSVRIPDFEKGDIVKTSFSLCLVKGIKKNQVVLLDLKSGTERIQKISEIKDYSVFRKEENVREADVLYREGKIAYILDPFDFKEKAVTDSREGRTVKIAKVDDEIYVIPSN